MPRIILSFIALVLLSGAGVVIYHWLHRDRPAAEPELTPLHESLHRSVESELGAPLLILNRVELTVKQQDLDSEAERIKNLATKLRGSATINHFPTDPDRELLVEIPPASAQQFIEAAQDRTKIVLEAPPNSIEKNQIIEVNLHVAK
jgi:hypothetical protein